jgi:hypothetical protein
MDTKESWIDETINSLDGMHRAPADPELFRKLQTRPGYMVNEPIGLEPSFYWYAAAGIAILLTLNVLTALYYYDFQSTSQVVPEAFAADYLSYMGTIKL